MEIRLNKLLRVLLVHGLALTFSCSDQNCLILEEYRQYLNSEECPLNTSKEINDIKYAVRVQPPQLTLMNSVGDSIKTELDFNRYLKYYMDKWNVVLLISDADQSDHLVKRTIFDQAKFQAILSYANTELAENVMLVQDNDTLYTSLIHLEPANSMQPLLRISMNFQGNNPNAESYTIIFNDDIFQNGPMKFRYTSEQFKNLPTLKI